MHKMCLPPRSEAYCVRVSRNGRLEKLDEASLKMFQTCGSATLLKSGRTINVREGSNDYPSAALPLLPRKRYCQIRSVAGRQATLSVPYLPRGTRTDLSAGV